MIKMRIRPISLIEASQRFIKSGFFLIEAARKIQRIDLNR